MVAKKNQDEREDQINELEKESKQLKDGESDTEPARDSVSSQGEMPTTEENKPKRASRVPQKPNKKLSEENGPRASRGRADQQETNKLRFKPSQNNTNKSARPNRKVSEKTSRSPTEKKPENGKVPAKPPSEDSEEADDRSTEEVKELDISGDSPSIDQSIGSEDETIEKEDNGMDEEEKVNVDKQMEEMEQRIEEMKTQVEKLEEELREVAALEISLYSVVPEHGSSAHKVHTPARRLSRLYIHACKHWSPDRRATIAKNTVSGLIIIAKSCGNDVSRLTFWLSNTVVLRQIISQAFGNSDQSNPTVRNIESNGSVKKTDMKNPLKWKTNSGSKQLKKLGFMQLDDDWQETSTFTAALKKIEFWIFSRIVESVWWQTLTPHMQSPVEDMYSEKGPGKLRGPALGDQQQGSFSINLWKRAFQDAFTRLCPVRAGGHECGCLPVLANLVMEQCVARLDVAMFNAILRESANEIPTDPVSDPIVDPKVLPIPAGDLSFGSGAQLKNSVGNWSRWLTDTFDMDMDDSIKEEQVTGDDGDDQWRGDTVSKSFHLLNALSDLLMLPKDMLIDRHVRKEVCPSLGLPIIKRILCNFTPDEFCPDAVPGAVLEALNADSVVERRLSDNDPLCVFPCTASPVTYAPPSPFDVAMKVADAGGKAELGRNTSNVQKKGYSSDEELNDVESPLTSIIDRTPLSSPIASNGIRKATTTAQSNLRYELLRVVWSG
ncbi:hypothetical protein QJS10_CPA06g01770 [Acorus calamus]|uniref:Dilute domain-containing protein n=1 Tax=Acorus calamus TaxID=4465 RepID=A0AAV9ENL2_ACOCL|nr:hypothetical protein QJS10_CPA06g01770 [Acorus calamus]